MSSVQKTLLSLLITLLLFAGFCAFAFSGGFNYIEVKFYTPRMVHSRTQLLKKLGESYTNYADSLMQSFASFTLKPENSTYIEREASLEEVEKRGELAGKLFEEVPALEGIRIVENDGIHIHFSTYDGDILQQSEKYLAWKDYPDLNEINFSNITTSDNGEYASTSEKIIARSSVYFDSDGDRFVFSMPYFDKYTAWRGSIFFYVRAGDFTDEVISQNLLPLNTRSKVIAPRNTEANLETPSTIGIVFGMPYLAYKDRTFMVDRIEEKWGSGKVSEGDAARLVVVKEKGDDEVMVLVSSAAFKYCRMGWICREEVFSFSELEKAVILICLFMTLFLLVFTLFNLRHDDMVVISSRIRKFELSLFRQYLDRKNSADWRALEKEVSLRKQDVNAEIIRSLGKRGKKHRKEVDLYLDQSWSELMSAMSGGRRMAEVIQSYKDSADPALPASEPEVVKITQAPLASVQQADDAEELEPLEEVSDAEELEPLEEASDAEELEPLEEADDVEELEDLEEIEDAQEVEELEELDEGENMEQDKDVSADFGISSGNFEEKPSAAKKQEISAEDAPFEFNDISNAPGIHQKEMSESEKNKLSKFESYSFDPMEDSKLSSAPKTSDN